MNIQFAMLNGWEIVMILGVVLILFGAKKLPELARGLGQGIREFKKATREVTDELQSAIDVEDHSGPSRKIPANSAPRSTAKPQTPAEAEAEAEPESAPVPHETEHSSAESKI